MAKPLYNTELNQTVLSCAELSFAGCAVLCYAMLCCAMLCCVLCYAMLCCAVLYYTLLYFTVVCCAVLNRTELCCSALHPPVILNHPSLSERALVDKAPHHVWGCEVALPPFLISHQLVRVMWHHRERELLLPPPPTFCAAGLFPSFMCPHSYIIGDQGQW